MKNKIYLLLIILPVLFLAACSKVQVEQNSPLDSSQKASATADAGECNLGRYSMDCGVVGFLENDLAWTTEKNSQAFCAYEFLGQVDNVLFLQALCEEYYVQDEKIVCPDEESRQDCFMAKDAERKACQEKCEIEKTEPYLVQGSGVSIPVKVTKTAKGFTLWQPRDGSLYTGDLSENFPKDIYKKLQDVNGGLLQSIVIERAEKYFDTKVKFNVSGDMGEACASYEDCGMLPMEYAIRSNCPHTVKCLDSKCVAGCYDTSDYTRFPLLK